VPTLHRADHRTIRDGSEPLTQSERASPPIFKDTAARGRKPSVARARDGSEAQPFRPALFADGRSSDRGDLFDKDQHNPVPERRVIHTRQCTNVRRALGGQAVGLSAVGVLATAAALGSVGVRVKVRQ
jgi:hypothetical protein